MTWNCAGADDRRAPRNMKVNEWTVEPRGAGSGGTGRQTRDGGPRSFTLEAQ